MDGTDEFSFVLKVSHVPGAGVGVFAVHDIANGEPEDTKQPYYKKK